MTSPERETGDAGPEAPGTPPTVSFGLAVRNGAATVVRCLDSILSQDFRDLEIVVCDNASSDATPKLVEEIAARDPRVRFHPNPENIGLIENVNRVFRLSRGHYFRWIGVDDWLEPGYVRACVEALEADPGAIVATTWYRTWRDDGRVVVETYRGEMLESPDPARRFARMMSFFHAGDTRYDPVYSMMRRSALDRTPLIRMMENADRVLSTELALMGRFVHVPRVLANRTRAYRQEADHAALMRRFHPVRHAELPASPTRLLRELLRLVDAAPLTPAQRLRCRARAGIFILREVGRRLNLAFRRFRRARLGLTRDRLRRRDGDAPQA